MTITLGATEAIFSAVLALVGPGDEVVVFDPAYDSYDPAVRLAGARCVHVPLLPPAFAYDWDRVRAAVNGRTRMIIINSPHNPACTVMSRDDLDQLAALAADHNLLVLSDEVYEHIVYAPARHHSVLAHAGLRDRALAVFSYGKSLHATGLRVGYCVAPPAAVRPNCARCTSSIPSRLPRHSSTPLPITWPRRPTCSPAWRRSSRASARC